MRYSIPAYMCKYYIRTIEQNMWVHELKLKAKVTWWKPKEKKIETHLQYKCEKKQKGILSYVWFDEKKDSKNDWIVSLNYSYGVKLCGNISKKVFLGSNVNQKL